MTLRKSMQIVSLVKRVLVHAGMLSVLGILHEINGKGVYSVENLRAAVAALASGEPVALLVERGGQWSYVAFVLP
jgi:hypothetical protein